MIILLCYAATIIISYSFQSDCGILLIYPCRNTCLNISHKDFKKAEVKVIIICCCYVILGLVASIAYAVSSVNVRGLKVELMNYFECERVHSGVDTNQSCDRNEFERFTNVTSKVLGYSALALYPVITLIYFFRKKEKPQSLRHTLTTITQLCNSCRCLNVNTLVQP